MPRDNQGENRVASPRNAPDTPLIQIVALHADGVTALRILDTITRLDLLVTDVGLPNGMNGRQVAEAVRQHRPGVPVLFITGYSGKTLGRGTEVVRKPFDLDTLARRTQSLLSVSASAPEIKR